MKITHLHMNLLQSSNLVSLLGLTSYFLHLKDALTILVLLSALVLNIVSIKKKKK